MRALVLLGSLGAARAYTGYAIGPDALSYQAAVSYCDGIGGEIASIHSDADNEAARDACGDNVCWIGLRESGGEQGTHAFEQIWRWRDNSTAGVDSYHNWAPGEPEYNEYGDERYAVMNDPGYYGSGSSGLWFTTTDTWYTVVPLCGVNAPTTAPTLSPAPTSSPKPTYSFSCDNDRCGVSERKECCHSSWESPVCSGGYVPVKFGDHSCLFTCCTIPVTHEEVTASGHQWEDHEDRKKKKRRRRRRLRRWLGLLHFPLSLNLVWSPGDRDRNHRVHLRAVRVLQDVSPAKACVQGPGRHTANDPERGRADSARDDRERAAPRASLQGIDRRERARLVVPARIRPPFVFLQFHNNSYGLLPPRGTRYN